MDPLLKKQVQRFKKHRRGYFSFWLLSFLFIVSLGSELLCNNQPLIVSYQSSWYFPVFKFYPAELFGQTDSVAPDYKALGQDPKFQNSGNWIWFAPIPYGSNESMKDLPSEPPSHPTKDNWLGTDDRGRDLLTRLIYGFRNSMVFALLSWACIAVIGFAIGAFQGFRGGWIDLYGQRLIEVWSSLPKLYIILLLLSVYPPSLILLIAFWIPFNWMGMASYVRAEVLRIRKMDFIQSAQAVGASTPRILFVHVLRNSLTPIVTLSPFIISASVAALASLDYLGLGLPPPAASWGELLRQGKENLQSWWLVVFPFLSLFATLLLLNFVGEAIREAFAVRESQDTATA